jgi:hypothetical protein
MPWAEMQTNSGAEIAVTAEKERELNKAKEEGAPVIVKEASAGMKPFDPVEYQPVRSPDIYEGEFGVKGSDLIFHFWPANYHNAERAGKALPRFKPGFDVVLKQVFTDAFGAGVSRVEVFHDPDVGAFCVLAHGWGDNQYHRELSIKACEALHQALGGEHS